MNTNVLPTIHSPSQTLPVAMVFSSRLLLTRNPSVTTTSTATSKSGPPKQMLGQLNIRATKLTEILKNIPGYSHGGLNE